jgi:hypothetical protein
MDGTGDRWFVSDDGYGYLEADMMGGSATFRRIAKPLADRAGVKFDERCFFVNGMVRPCSCPASKLRLELDSEESGWNRLNLCHAGSAVRGKAIHGYLFRHDYYYLCIISALVSCGWWAAPAGARLFFLLYFQRRPARHIVKLAERDELVNFLNRQGCS